MPLWEGGARYGSLRIAKANAEESQPQARDHAAHREHRVAQALRGVAVAEQERTVSANARDFAKEASRLTLRAYEVGTGTSFDLVNAAQQERAAELDLVVKEFQVIRRAPVGGARGGELHVLTDLARRLGSSAVRERAPAPRASASGASWEVPRAKPAATLRSLTVGVRERAPRASF